jgi:hypothetical protein
MYCERSVSKHLRLLGLLSKHLRLSGLFKGLTLCKHLKKECIVSGMFKYLKISVAAENFGYVNI